MLNIKCGFGPVESGFYAINLRHPRSIRLPLEIVFHADVLLGLLLHEVGVPEKHFADACEVIQFDLVLGAGPEKSSVM